MKKLFFMSAVVLGTLTFSSCDTGSQIKNSEDADVVERDTIVQTDTTVQETVVETETTITRDTNTRDVEVDRNNQTDKDTIN